MMKAKNLRRTLLEEYLIRVELALGVLGDKPIPDVVTSRDARLVSCASELQELASDVRQWRPPFGSQEDLVTTVLIAGPGGEIGPTLHLDGDAVRFVLSGSARFNGVDLGPGDWMFIPAGTGYRMTVGPQGVISLSAVYRPLVAAALVDEACPIEAWLEMQTG